jgi:1-phosphofructokinase family hexose kinase
MQIFTLTLNPAFDIHYELDTLTLGAEQYARAVLREAGGKGINTSRALTVNGIENTAFAVLGADNSAAFEALLKQDGMTCRTVTVPGAIRENLTLHPDNQPETRISLNHFTVAPSVLDALYNQLTAMGERGDLLSFAGRIPQGLTTENVCTFLRRLRQYGFRLIVDCNSLTIRELMQIHPWLIKPNASELRALCSTADPLAAARTLIRVGAAEQVLVTLGERGALFCTESQTQRMIVPPLTHPLSTIGAGDSTIAGFMAAVARNLPRAEWPVHAVAWGTAACMTPGTRPPRPEDILAVLPQIAYEYT